MVVQKARQTAWISDSWLISLTRRSDVSSMAAKKDKSMESMKNAIIAKLVMVAKTRPAHSKPSIISTKAMGELVDRVEEAVPGWVKKSAHLEKVRTFQSALQQAKNHDIDVKCLTTEESD